jgi:hypothetical protein
MQKREEEVLFQRCMENGLIVISKLLAKQGLKMRINLFEVDVTEVFFGEHL